MHRDKVVVALGLVVGLATFSDAMLAHHGTSNYDNDHPITLSGVVTEYRFSNPHVLIFVDGKTADGAAEKWVVETGPPQRLYRAGWRGDSLKSGDKITVTGFPMKDGSKTMGLRKLTTSDGKELSQGNQ